LFSGVWYTLLLTCCSEDVPGFVTVTLADVEDQAVPAAQEQPGTGPNVAAAEPVQVAPAAVAVHVTFNEIVSVLQPGESVELEPVAVQPPAAVEAPVIDRCALSCAFTICTRNYVSLPKAGRFWWKKKSRFCSST
jgi:hypothetical protein